MRLSPRNPPKPIVPRWRCSKSTERKTLPGPAYIVKVELKTLPEPTSRGFALYVGDLQIPKYWTYRQGIWFKVFDPQFFVEHKGEPIRFSLNDTEFVKTRLKLTVPKMAKTKGGRTAARLPAQEDVLK